MAIMHSVNSIDLNSKHLNEKLNQHGNLRQLLEIARIGKF